MGDPISEMAPIANQKEPYRVSFDRTLIMSADPGVRKLLENLEPTGAGVILRDGTEGIDEEFVITENRGEMTARLVGTNYCPTVGVNFKSRH